MRGCVFIIFLAVVSWLSSALAAAPTTQPTKTKIEIATGEYAPLTGESFTDGGPVTAIVTSILERMGQKFTIAYVPWKRADDGVRKGLYWAAFPYVKSPEREKVFLFSSPIAKTGSGFFARADAPESFDDHPEYWKNKILCRPAGYDSFSLRPVIEKYQIKMEQPLTLDSCYLMLKAKKVDLISNPEIIGWYYIKKLFHDTSGFRLVKDHRTTGTFHLIMSKKDPNAKLFLQEFNATLKKMESSGEYKKVYEASAKNTERAFQETQ